MIAGGDLVAGGLMPIGLGGSSASPAEGILRGDYKGHEAEDAQDGLKVEKAAHDFSASSIRSLSGSALA